MNHFEDLRAVGVPISTRMKNVGRGLLLLVGVAVVAFLLGRASEHDQLGKGSAQNSTVVPTAQSVESTTTVTLGLTVDSAKALIDAGELDKAELVLSDLLKVNDRDATTLYNLGVIAQQRGRNAVAVDWYTKALEIQPDFHSSVYNRGLAYLALNDATKAVADFERAADLAPDWVKGKFYLGKAYVAVGQFAKGNELITEAETADPSLKG